MGVNIDAPYSLLLVISVVIKSIGELSSEGLAVLTKKNRQNKLPVRKDK